MNMLLEYYSGAPLSKILSDLEEIYTESENVSKFKNTFQDSEYKDIETGTFMRFEAIILLADYYIEEYVKGINSLKAGNPSKFFLDRLYDIENQARIENEMLEKIDPIIYKSNKILSDLYSLLYDYTLTLCMLYLIYEPVEERYFFGNYDNDLKYNANIIKKSGNFLLFDGKKVELNSKSRENKIIKFMFENAIDRIVDFDEIEEFFDQNSDFSSNDNSSYYHACRRINNKISLKFLTNTSQIRRKKYMKNLSYFNILI